MALRRKRMVVLPLLLALACIAEAVAPATAGDSSVTESALTPSQYAAELDRLASAIQKLSRAD